LKWIPQLTTKNVNAASSFWTTTKFRINLSSHWLPPLFHKLRPLVPWCDLWPNSLLWFTCPLPPYKVLSSLRTIRSIASASWGPSKESLSNCTKLSSDPSFYMPPRVSVEFLYAPPPWKRSGITITTADKKTLCKVT